jgi:anti-sigma B factor antagonist
MSYVPFSVEIRPADDRAAVVPRGDLDLATVDEVRTAVDDLVAQGFGAVVLDLRELTFIDSSGLRMVVGQTRRVDVAVTLIDGAEPVSRLFDLVGVREALPFETAG